MIDGFVSRRALLQTLSFLVRGGAPMPPINNFYPAYGFFYSSRLSPVLGSLKSSSPPVPHSPVSRSPPTPGSPTHLVSPARGLGASHAFLLPQNLALLGWQARSRVTAPLRNPRKMVHRKYLIYSLFYATST